MCLQFAFLLVTRVTTWLRLSQREEAWQTAEILILRHQLAVLQRRQPRGPHLNWPDRALLAALLTWVPQMGLVSETRITGPTGETRVRMAKRRVSSGRYRRRSRGCGGWAPSPPLRLPLQPYVLRHDKRLARQSFQRIVVMVQYEVIYTDLARRILVGRDCVAMF